MNMEVALWNELNDEQAKKVCGGRGSGDVNLGDVNKELQDFTRSDLGYKNPNKAARDFGAKNYGEIIVVNVRDLSA
jgi:hypothetical protein